MVSWLPESNTIVEFGSDAYGWTTGFKDWNRKYYGWGGRKDPTVDEIQNFSQYATMKLSCIRYKTYQNEIAGIRLEFSNGL